METNDKSQNSKRNRPVSILLALFLCLVLSLPVSVLTLRWVNPPVTAFTLLENWGDLEAERYNLREWWIGPDELPDHLKWAVIAAEDQQFYEHWGFDTESIKQAWEERREGVRNRGASTISQQTAKNLFLWPAHSFFRKGLEAVITIFIELLWPKERIVEVYLNVAEFGPGLYGIGKASDHYFGVRPSNLEPEMSARFAAVLPSPKRMRVEPPSPFAKERSEWILRQINQLTGIRYYEEPVAEEPDTIPLIPDYPELPDLNIDTIPFFDSGTDTLNINDFEPADTTLGDNNPPPF